MVNGPVPKKSFSSLGDHSNCFTDTSYIHTLVEKAPESGNRRVASLSHTDEKSLLHKVLPTHPLTETRVSIDP